LYVFKTLDFRHFSLPFFSACHGAASEPCLSLFLTARPAGPRALPFAFFQNPACQPAGPPVFPFLARAPAPWPRRPLLGALLSRPNFSKQVQPQPAQKPPVRAPKRQAGRLVRGRPGRPRGGLTKICSTLYFISGRFSRAGPKTPRGALPGAGKGGRLMTLWLFGRPGAPPGAEGGCRGRRL
jgi:hypothetical protein